MPSNPFGLPSTGGPYPWTHLAAQNSRRDFRFALFADRTGGTRAGRFEQAVRQMNGLRPEFILHIGDIIEGAPNDMDAVNAQWDEALGMVAQVEAPLFLVPGNHDVNNLAQIEVWKQRFGPLYYSFVYEDVLFIVLNSEDPPGKQLSDEQVAFVERTLRENASARWTFLFVHVPLWIYDHPHNWDRVEALLRDRKYTVFAGHMHEYTKHTRQDMHYIVLAASGAWTFGRGTAWGEFDHITWVAMSDEGPRITNLALDGIWNENVHTVELRNELEPLHWGEAVTSRGLWVDTPAFEQGTAVVEIHNPLQREVKAQILAHPTRQVCVTPTSWTGRLQPGQRHTLTLQLHAPIATPVKDVDPVRVDWQFQFPYPGREDVTQRGTHRIVIDGLHGCPRRTWPVQLDGRVRDWPALPWRCIEPGQIQQTPDEWQGPADASFDFGVAYDDAYVYVAVHVHDQDLRFRGRTEPWRKDGIIIRFDARPEPARQIPRQRWMNRQMDGEFARYFGKYPGPGAFDDYLFLGISLGATPEVTTVYQPERLPEGVRCVCAPAPDGYTAEVAIPVSYLEERQGKDWDGFRLNLSVSDYDDIFAAPHAAIWWRPEWSSAEDMPRSGTFRRLP